MLECLLSKYKETPFDVNKFLGMTFRKDWVVKRHAKQTLSYKPLKCMIEIFADQAIDACSFLKTMIEELDDCFFQSNCKNWV